MKRLVLAALILVAPAAGAQQGLVVLDGSLGEGAVGVVPPGIDSTGQPADYLITPELGVQRGSNFFFSFESFSVGQGETATFDGSPSLAADNVIARVTGGEPSLIDGTLRVTLPGTDLWFMNPSGVVFGEGSSLDVAGGNVNFTTADLLEFADGESFAARFDGAVPLLSFAPPTEFGFLETNTASISIDGGRIQVADGAALSIASAAELVIGGDLSGSGIEIRGERILVPRDGLIRIASSGAGVIRLFGVELVVEGTVDALSAVGAEASVVLEFERIDIRPEGVIVHEGSSSGRTAIQIDAADLLTIDGVIFSDGGDVLLLAPVISVRRGGNISAGAVGPGSIGGQIDIRGDLVEIDGAQITSEGAGSQQGQIRIEGRDIRIREGEISTRAVGPGSIGGQIAIRGERVAIESARIGSDALGGAEGGVISVEATNRLTLEQTSVSAFVEAGDGGDVRLGAERLLILRDSRLIAGSNGSGGDISVEAPRGVVVLERSLLAANAGSGLGGNVRMIAGGVISDPASVIRVSGEQENITPSIDLSAALAPLQEVVLDAGALVAQRCDERRRGERQGSFVASGRDALPPGPEGLLSARSALAGSVVSQMNDTGVRLAALAWPCE